MEELEGDRLGKIKQEADSLPLAYKERVLRQVRQIEEGQRQGMDVSVALGILTKEVGRLRERLGKSVMPEVQILHPVRFTCPWGEGQVDEARRMVTVGGVEFSEKEIDVLYGKGLDKKVMGFVMSAKRELGGRVVR